MSNTQQDHANWTAPLRELIASLREMQAHSSRNESSSCSIVLKNRSAIYHRWMVSRP
jgi:hypothetical protein